MVLATRLGNARAPTFLTIPCNGGAWCSELLLTQPTHHQPLSRPRASHIQPISEYRLAKIVLLDHRQQHNIEFKALHVKYRREVHQLLLRQVDMLRYAHLAEAALQLLLAIGMQRTGGFLVR